MKRKIIAYKGYYRKFFKAQDAATQEKTPTKEINKALKLKAEYEERKKQGDF
jgi:hypothetical protein